MGYSAATDPRRTQHPMALKGAGEPCKACDASCHDGRLFRWEPALEMDTALSGKTRRKIKTRE